MGYADDTSIYAVIPRPLSRPQAMESLKQDLAGIDSWFLKCLMSFNPKKTKSMVLTGLRPMLPVLMISLLVLLSLKR